MLFTSSGRLGRPWPVVFRRPINNWCTGTLSIGTVSCGLWGRRRLRDFGNERTLASAISAACWHRPSSYYCNVVECPWSSSKRISKDTGPFLGRSVAFFLNPWRAPEKEKKCFYVSSGFPVPPPRCLFSSTRWLALHDPTLCALAQKGEGTLHKTRDTLSFLL